MDDLIKLVKTYRVTAGLAERDRLAEAIFRHVEPAMRSFVFSAIRPQFAEDVLQEALKAIARSLKTCRSETGEEFLRWCRGVARHKIHDQYREFKNERLQPLPPEEIWEKVEESARAAPLSAGDRHDLEFAMNLIRESKPECAESLWTHYFLGCEITEVAEEAELKYDTARRRIERCLEFAQELVAKKCKINTHMPTPR